MGRKYSTDRKSSMLDNLARELKKHIDVLTPTFEANNLQVIQFNVKPYNNADAECYVFVELAAIEGQSIPATVYLKINLYDEDDELCLVEDSIILQETFAGYDTYVITCDDPNILTTAAKGRLYVVR